MLHEMTTRSAIVVRKAEAQMIRCRLERYGLWDNQRRLKTISSEQVAIPVTVDQISWEDIGFNDRSVPCQIENIDLPPSKTTKLETPHTCLKRKVNQLLEDTGRVVSPELFAELPSCWEKHGDLILVPESAFVSKEWSQLPEGKTLWKTVCECLGGSRLARKSVVSTDGFRSPRVTLLYGKDGWVEHIDNGIRYSYDVTRCMFSIGNITEKLRVAQFDCHGETVLDMYAGIGYFTLPYLVHTGAERVIACEWNPAAVEALKRNLQLNDVQDRCTVYQGDNRQVCPRGVADRVNLGLIPSSEAGWAVACAALKSDSGGIFHIHGNVTSKSLPDSTTTSTVGIVDKTDQEVLSTGCDSDSQETGIQRTQICGVMGESESRLGLGVCNKIGKVLENSLSESIDKCLVMGNRNNSKLFKMSCNQKIKPAWCDWAAAVSDKICDILESHHQRAWVVKILHVEHVKSYAPHIDHLVLDLDCRPVG